MSTIGEFNPRIAPPGISWTAPKKGRPWLRPPKYVKIEEVAALYVSLMGSVNVMDNMLDAIETGVPLIAIAESLMLFNVSKGIHSLDAGVLVMPVIVEMLVTTAEAENIDYIVFAEDAVETDKPSSREIRMAVKRAMNKKEQPEEMVEEEEMMTGLMSKQETEVEDGV